MASKTETLHLMHASMRFDMGNNNFENQVRRMIENGKPDILTLTESDAYRTLYRNIALSMGYRMVDSPYNQDLIAVNVSRPQTHISDRGGILVIPKDNNNRQVAINWVRVSFHGIRIYHHVSHWLSRKKTDYKDQHRKVTAALIQAVRLRSKQNNLAFFAGDINEDDDPKGNTTSGWNQQLREANMMTIWDEFKVYPPTHPGTGSMRTIDVIGKANKANVKGVRHKTWPKMASDHRPISAWYEIDIEKESRDQGGNNDGGGGGGGGNDGGNDGGGGGGNDGGNDDTPTDGDQTGDPRDDDPWSGGGKWWNWDDYLDPTIYNIPQATDDSDTTNG